MRDRLRRRARRLVEALPRTADELRGRLSEKPWARLHGDLVEQVVAECAEKGLLGGGGHAKALRDRLFNYAVSLLAHSARTERELRRRLARPVWSTSVLVDDVDRGARAIRLRRRRGLCASLRGAACGRWTKRPSTPSAGAAREGHRRPRADRGRRSRRLRADPRVGGHRHADREAISLEADRYAR